MRSATLEQVLVQVGGCPEPIALGIDDDGLEVGAYGKLVWAGATLEVQPKVPKGCRIRFCSAHGVPSTFFVTARSLGGPEGIVRFARWLESIATGGGATLEAERS